MRFSEKIDYLKKFLSFCQFSIFFQFSYTSKKSKKSHQNVEIEPKYLE